MTFAPSANHNHLVHVVSGPGQRIIAQTASLAFGAQPAPLGIMSFVPAGMPATFTASAGDLRICRLRFSQETAEALLGAPVTWRFQSMAPFLSLRTPSVLTAMQRLEAECLRLGVAQKAYVEAIGIAVVIDLYRSFANTSDVSSAGGGKLVPWQLRRIEEFVRDACSSRQISVADFAALCGVSASHLARCFKQTTGLTLSSYVQAVRIDRARGMLVESDLPLKEIAAACGFSTAAYFSTAFQRASGESPRSYRVRVRAKTYRLARLDIEPTRQAAPLRRARAGGSTASASGGSIG